MSEPRIRGIPGDSQGTVPMGALFLIGGLGSFLYGLNQGPMIFGLVGVFFIAVGVAMLVYAATKSNEVGRIMSQGVRTTGEVTEIEDQVNDQIEGSGHIFHTLNYHYADQAGKAYLAEVSLTQAGDIYRWRKRVDAGDRAVVIFYDQTNPKQHVIFYAKS